MYPQHDLDGYDNSYQLDFPLLYLVADDVSKVIAT